MIPDTRARFFNQALERLRCRRVPRMLASPVCVVRADLTRGAGVSSFVQLPPKKFAYP